MRAFCGYTRAFQFGGGLFREVIVRFVLGTGNMQIASLFVERSNPAPSAVLCFKISACPLPRSHAKSSGQRKT